MSGFTNVTAQNHAFFNDVKKALVLMGKRSGNQTLRSIHAPFVDPLARQLRAAIPDSGKPKSPGGRQPYAKLKRSVRLGRSAKTRNPNSRAVHVNLDAFHFWFLESGTKMRKTQSGSNRGRIKGTFKRASSPSGWSSTGWVRRWNEKNERRALREIPMAYDRKILSPGVDSIRNRYTVRAVMRIGNPRR